MIPTVNFVWSFIYQEKFLPKGLDYNREEASKYVLGFIEKIIPEWNTIKNKVLRYMEEITNLRWTKSEINCYVLKISSSHAFSDPLTIPLNLKTKNNIYPIYNFIDTLIHELIHNLNIQSKNEKLDLYYEHLINNKYKDFTWITAIHVPIHAIHKEIFDKFFEEKDLQKHLEIMSKNPDYKKAWDIVFEEGSKNILKEMKEFIK